MLFDKIALVYILFEKYIYSLSLEMAGPGNQHCANCIGTLLFPIVDSLMTTLCTGCGRKKYPLKIFGNISPNE